MILGSRPYFNYFLGEKSSHFSHQIHRLLVYYSFFFYLKWKKIVVVKQNYHFVIIIWVDRGHIIMMEIINGRVKYTVSQN